MRPRVRIGFLMLGIAVVAPLLALALRAPSEFAIVVALFGSFAVVLGLMVLGVVVLSGAIVGLADRADRSARPEPGPGGGPGRPGSSD